jgi:hypothetical protein
LAVTASFANRFNSGAGQACSGRIFGLQPSANQRTIETIKTLAGMARLVIADLTDARDWAGRLFMSKAYPHFKPSYAHDELVEHFLLTPADQFVLAFRGDANRKPSMAKAAKLIYRKRQSLPEPSSSNKNVTASYHPLGKRG